jgi:hypothetical protein
MDSPVDYIKRNPKYKYWTLYTEKDKRVASHDDDDDPAEAFSQMYGFLAGGTYRLLIRKQERADRGSMSVTFKKDEENQYSNMAGFGQQSSPGGLGLSPFELGMQLGQIRAEQERQRALMARLEKVLPFLEELAENEKVVMKALLDLTDDDDENDDNAFDKVSENLPKITSIVSNVRSMMAKGA